MEFRAFGECGRGLAIGTGADGWCGAAGYG